MGTRNSTTTRVAPVFDELSARNPENWLSRLLALPSLPGKDRPIHLPSETGNIEESHWKVEKKLSAPTKLLEWLLDHAELQPGCSWGSSPTTVQKRQALLLHKDAELMQAARQGLAKRHVSNLAWFVFEGSTCPDVFIQTEKLIIVIEGKRTERSITTKTSWMANRHQMLRHIDGAFEICGGRQVFGFLIVEGDGGSDAIGVPTRWADAARLTVSQPVLDASLPHRTVEERQRIASSFLGVTTWQRVCTEFGIDFDRLTDEALKTEGK